WVALEGKIICGLAGAVVLFGGGWVALRTLLVRVPPPTGHELTRGDAPKLFAVLDDLQSKLRAAPFHRVYVVPDCNASVVQVPRLGVFGWSRNYLLLGLPLLDGLSPAELRAVLAHEFAHLSREHGRFSHWLYRLRRSWEDAFKQLSLPQVQGQVSFRPLAVKFVDWFWPKFNAHAFVLSRANEYEADALAAKFTGPQNIASALVRLRFLARQLEEKLWPEIWKSAHAQPTPPDDVFDQLRRGMVAGPTAEDRGRWLAEAFRVHTTNADTHPCLTERLRSVGELQRQKTAAISGAAEVSAAAEIFGPVLKKIRLGVQEFWRKEAETTWRSHHARAGALNQRLNSFTQAVPDPSTNADALWDKALVLINLRDENSVTPLLRQILTLRPDHPEANFHLGRILVGSGNPDGETHLNHLMEFDEAAVPSVCALLREHYRLNGRPDRMREIEARLDCHEKNQAASQRERSEAGPADTFISHALTSTELESLRNTLATEPELIQATLVQKQMKYFPKQKFFVLCVRRRKPWYRLPNHDRDCELINHISMAVKLPGRVLVITPSGSFHALAAKVCSVSNAEIWRRNV
ncbi:MAG: M48 family metalloprotease, partial [Verrucomicrobia bacterium]|nr:M48 family metalloprotease [Verrucomicrobiota bacterium]